MGDPSKEPFRTINAALMEWRQGDVILDVDLPLYHLAIAGQPLTDEAGLASQEQPESNPDDLILVAGKCPGFIVLTQTCDLVRCSTIRPYAELAALVEVEPNFLRQVEKCYRPAYTFVPALADKRLVADLSRVMTVEKAVLASFKRQPGLRSTKEITAFQQALARYKSRFAFPDDFNDALADFQERLKKRAGKNSEEGQHVEALAEIRVIAQPDWYAEKVSIVLWFIKNRDPEPENWLRWINEWTSLIDQKGKYLVENAQVVRPEDMRVSEYLESQRLDLDHLS